MSSSTKIKPLIIIGTGLAGYNLAKEFRKIDASTPLLLITQDEGHFYSKPQLSTAHFYGKTPEQLVVTQAEVMAQQLNAQLFSHSKVKAIFPVQQTMMVETPQGEITLEYGNLVLAQGALPKPFPLLDNVHQHFRINNLQDYASFSNKLAHIEHLTLIGSGLVGCEFAYDLFKKVKSLHVITMDPYPLYHLIPSSMGKALQHFLESRGIVFHCSTHLGKVEVGTSLTLTLSSGKSLVTDSVVTAIGLSPNITLAQLANIKTEQGIVVDSTLKTSCDHIYALGDCAQIDGICRQYVAPILQSARALAQTLTGNATKVTFPPTPISLKVHDYPIIVHPPTTSGQWQIEQQDDGIKALFIDQADHLQGYALSGSRVQERQQCLKMLHQPVSAIA